MVRNLEAELRRRAGALLDAVPDGEPVDFLVEVAAELPMQMICILLGVPEDDRHDLFAAIEPGFDFRTGNGTEREPSSFDMLRYGRALIAEKRAQPGDDMLSVVVHARLDDVDPPTLTDDELYMFFSLLFSAGSETTRNAIAGGLAALVANSDQLHLLRAEPGRMPGAIEEILRWTTPSPSKRRTATAVAELAGHTIQPGDKVVVWEGSANRDELAFERAMKFDITRDPNLHTLHVAFGGGGPHFCLGAHIARVEIQALLRELLTRLPDLTPAGPAEWLASNFISGPKHLPVKFTAAARA
jgi:cytochrome P450